MKKGRLVGVAWVVLAALTSPAGAGGPADEEDKRLEGSWKILGLTVDGMDVPPQVIQGGRWTFRDGRIIVPGADPAKATFKVDPSRSPKEIDMTATEGPSRGKTRRCIYKIEGDRLTICFPEERRGSTEPERPREFVSEKGRSLIVLARITGE